MSNVWTRIRNDFPVLSRRIGGKQLIYFDTACMALKPKPIADAIYYYYTQLGACGGAGRSTHALGREVSELVEESREKFARFINAKRREEIIFTRNTTEGVNLVASTLRIPEGANIVSTTLEHHSGVLPFWRLQHTKKAKLRLVKAHADGSFDLADFEKAIDDQTAFVSVVHASNVTGSIAPIEEIAKIAHEHGALVLSDEAQYAPHHRLDAQKAGVDFMTISIHKMMGPSGMGVLWGRSELLEEMEPFLVGGDTIRDVKYENGTVIPEFLPPPHRFEAGLQNYAGMIGVGAVVDYLSYIGMENIERRERQLTRRLMRILEPYHEENLISIIGPLDPSKRGALAAFTLKNVAVRDAVIYFDDAIPGYRFMMRAGAHCVNPFHYSLGLNPSKGEGSLRVSLYIYNEMWELELFEEKFDEFIRKAN